LLSKNIFITLDIDVLDPSIMPATGTPEPDGWLWHELCFFLKDIAASKNIVGLDVVELSPMLGNNAPNFTTAKLIYRIIGYIAQSKKWIKP
jgi:agmatinase